MSWIQWIIRAGRFILNPSNWSRIFLLVEGVLALVQRAREALAKRKVEKKIEEQKQDEVVVSDPTKSKAERAEALCRIEKRWNPQSDCDASHGASELPVDNPKT